ncbi:hypothetical protein ACJRO7_008485 [Eucalyptus globulus]|uniref:Calmodulin-binding protein 60 A-like n=1 Tax=Eucalyptus globulus TaxID=34317 RepID=A0ABD3IR52_EUCGL
MSQKRQQEDGKARSDGSFPDDKRRRIPTLKNVVLEVMKMQPVQHLLEPILEPLIRKVVKEEVDIALKKYVNSMKRSYEKEVHHFETRSLQLQFMSSLSLPVFTGARIEGEECSAVKIALVDALSGQIVDSGPESLAKVEIVVLEGDFDSDETENWTVEEFKNNIVREREGKKPLLTGEPILNLKDGVCSLGEIAFTDNSSWTRSRRFRIGARVIDNFDGIRIREARTESFIVRDHRGELYKKHHPPSLFDEVWRLEKIGKDGAFHKRLSRENIQTVKDFLILLHVDPSRLRYILGTGMSAKMWEVTIEHARTCVIDKRVYLYCPPTSQLKTGVVFNLVGQVMGLLSDCQYVPIEKLSEAEKVDAHNLVISAFQHWGEVVSFDEEAYLIAGSSHVSSAPCNSSSPKTEGSNTCRFLSCERISGLDYAQPNASSPDIMSSIYSTVDVSGLDDYTLHGLENMGLRYDQTLSFPSQVANSMICDARSMSQDFFDEDHLRFFDSDCPLPAQSTNFESQADLQCAVSEFLLKPSAVAIANAQKRWKKLFSVLKWFWVRKIVVMRRTRQREIQRW